MHTDGHSNATWGMQGAFHRLHKYTEIIDEIISTRRHAKQKS